MSYSVTPDEVIVFPSSNNAAARRCKSSYTIVQLNELLADLSPDHAAVDAASWDWFRFWEKLGLEPPRGQQTIGAASAALRALYRIASRLIDLVNAHQLDRLQFPQRLASELCYYDSNFNYIICYARHSCNFQGISGTDFAHSEVTLPATRRASSIIYDVYAFKAGAFTLLEEDGYLNVLTVRPDL